MHTDTTKAIADWRETVAKHVAAAEAVSAASPGAPGFEDLKLASRQASDRMQKLAREAWKAPASGWADIVLRAEIAQAAYWPDHHGEGVRQLYALFADPSDEDPSDFGERAIAHLLKAILGLGEEEPASGMPRPRPDWDAILGLRGCRDAIENTCERITTELDAMADRSGLTAAIAAGWEPDDTAKPQPEPPEADRDILVLPEPAELDEMLCRARQGVTTLRTVTKGWERQHGPHKLIDAADGAFLASLEFCADGIEALVDRMSERLDDAVEAPDTARRSLG